MKEPNKADAPNLTLAELLLWNQDQLTKLKEVPGQHEVPSLEGLRLNAIDVAKEQCARNGAAIDQYGKDYVAKPWMMQLFGSPQMVRIRNPQGEIIGVAQVLQILTAKPSQCEPNKA